MASRSSVAAPSSDTSRRTFRGRAGPTDRRLPKHQARRRKHAPRDEEKNKYGDEVDDTQTVREDNVQQGSKNQGIPNDEAEKEEILNIEEEKGEESNPVHKEIQHLMRRVSNVKESMQLSATANSNPSTWQQNALNPVRNCVGEWRATVSHYQDELEPSDCKAPALAVFELIQLSLQTGPLAGAKPGYFKRCGTNVAQQALEFLDSIVPNKEEAAILHFSVKQADAIDKWRNNARKAVESDKLPSKSVLKKQNKAKKIK